MEELIRISIEYYRNTVGIRLFGVLGVLYLLLSAPFIVLAFYMTLILEFSSLIVLPMMAAAIFWKYAKVEYDRYLVKHLAYFTHLESSSVSDQKTIYLQYLTCHISDSLHEAVRKLQDIIKTDKNSQLLGVSNGWTQFKRFVYEPESKSRIVSLLIYLVSIFALMIIVKGNNEVSIYQIIDSLSFDLIKSYFLWSLFMILLCYVALVIPVTFFVSFVLYPVMLKMSINGALTNHLITELNRYSFREQAIQLTKPSSGRAKGARR